MKKITSYSILFSGLCILSSCDYINKPLEKEPIIVAANCGAAYKITTSVGPATRKVLIEDYTGHECGNCPAAAIVAGNILTSNPNDVIVLSVHAGYFADVNPAPFEADYKTPAGNDWNTFFGITSNPNGMISRKDFIAGTHIKTYSSWATEVSTIIGLPAQAKITLVSKYDTLASCYSVDVKTKFLQNLTPNFAVSLVLMEEELIGTQKDYSQPTPIVLNYVHKHMMRGALNGTWGDQLNTAPVAMNDSVTKTISNVVFNPTYDLNKLYVIAYVYNKTTYEVVQVEKVKVR